MADVVDIKGDSWEKEVVQSEILTIVDFWHNKCPWCLKLNPILEEVAKEYKGKIKFAKVNVLADKSNQEIAKKYGIMGTPTLLFFCDGRTVGEAVGSRSKEQLIEILEEMLEKHKVCISQSSKLEI